MKYIVDIHGEIDGDYEIVGKYEERPTIQSVATDTNVGDTISRRAAIQAIDDLPNCYNGYSDTYDKACIIGVLEELPSAEQKHGYWIVTDIPNLTSTAQDVVTFTRQCRCSECGAMFGRDSDKYCYNCGARMEGGNE